MNVLTDQPETNSEQHSKVAETPKRRGGPIPGGPGQLRSLANLRPFKPGQSGNPNGKPKKRMTEALLKKLVLKRANDLAEALLREAQAGNVAAWKEAADRTEGRVAEKIEISGNVDLGLRIAAARERRRLRSTSDIDAVVVQDSETNQLVRDSNGTSASQDVDWKDVSGD